MAENQPGDILYYEAVQTEEGKKMLDQYTRELEHLLKDKFRQDIGVAVPSLTQAELREMECISFLPDEVTLRDMQDYIRAMLEAGTDAASEQNLNTILGLTKKIAVRSLTNSSDQPAVYGAATSVVLQDGNTYMAAYYIAERLCMASAWNISRDFKLHCYCLVIWKLA
ncbi:hypothetical protein [Taibaiella chishuiensis]|uniref:Uncharacterized protein n=1 Tax=Taibaiella chishuiensis TaxID=1434707 RepID=A0A2P8D2G9_9BACT|nr:hypothetical protein [Taibaiella chishuiensis]PSK91424.1 hypothetical protein B0I18_1057 [Taibaiella chishuiensis]